jgi:hypothetical protein
MGQNALLNFFAHALSHARAVALPAPGRDVIDGVIGCATHTSGGVIGAGPVAQFQ